MPAISNLIFRIAILQKQPRFLVAFLVQIMQQRRVGIARQLFGQLINARKLRYEVWFWIGRRHGFDGFLQFHQRGEQISFERRFHIQKGRLAAIWETELVSGAKCPLKYQAVKNRSVAASMSTTSELMK